MKEVFLKLLLLCVAVWGFAHGGRLELEPIDLKPVPVDQVQVTIKGLLLLFI